MILKKGCKSILVLLFGTSMLVTSVASPTFPPDKDYKDFFHPYRYDYPDHIIRMQLCTPTKEQSLKQNLESIIDEAYQKCFKTYEKNGVKMKVRMPFGTNDERSEQDVFFQEFYLGGKGYPEQLWLKIDQVSESEKFDKYINDLLKPGEKVIMFLLRNKNYYVYNDPIVINLMKKGPYPGHKSAIFILKTEPIITETDIYNYLYCIEAIGMDCSGFVYYIQKSIAKAFGVDLDIVLSQHINTTPKEVPQKLGTWFFDPQHGYSELIDDKIQNLRAGDIFLFRGKDGSFKHSAVIQSVDIDNGKIRYIQCTDWAPQNERGVHDSFIYFDPNNPKISLKHKSIKWTQEVYPTFIGEEEPQYWRNDCDRYLANAKVGGSLVVRLKLIKDLLEKIDPFFYESQP